MSESFTYGSVWGRRGQPRLLPGTEPLPRAAVSEVPGISDTWIRSQRPFPAAVGDLDRSIKTVWRGVELNGKIES